MIGPRGTRDRDSPFSARADIDAVVAYSIVAYKSQAAWKMLYELSIERSGEFCPFVASVCCGNTVVLAGPTSMDEVVSRP